MRKKLSHYDHSGRARMVDVSAKTPTRREAEASAFVVLKPEVLEALPDNPKGDPLEVARMAGTMAALSVYDMLKAADKGIGIREIVLERKSGGKSGEYRRVRKKS